MIAIQVPSNLRTHCAGATEFNVAANTVRDALDQIERHYPELYYSVCDETATVRQHINLFVNSSLVSAKQHLDIPLESGDVLSIFPAVSGG